jgi:hypothetical protein
MSLFIRMYIYIYISMSVYIRFYAHYVYVPLLHPPKSKTFNSPQNAPISFNAWSPNSPTAVHNTHYNIRSRNSLTTKLMLLHRNGIHVFMFTYTYIYIYI